MLKNILFLLKDSMFEKEVRILAKVELICARNKIHMRLHLTLFAILTLATTVFAQPSNDNCTSSIDIGAVPYCSNPAEYTNIDATASTIDPNNIPSCFNGGGVQRDVWFVFTVPVSGNIVDFTISVFGNQGGNGTLKNPQVAIYRGDCPTDLDLLTCAAAVNGTNTIAVDAIGLTPGVSYYIRVNDFSASASPNSGTFKLCVEEYIAEFNMGQVPGSASCQGTLYDSGGPNGDYQNGEDLSFTICPQEFHQCIILNVTYNTEQNFDIIRFIQGDDTSDPAIVSVNGSGTNLEIQVPTNCATIAFSSDIFTVNEGFVLTWACSSSPCTAPPITTCSEPSEIPSLPYAGNNLSNCFSGDAVTFDPCGSDYVLGNDYVFAYTSSGNECIKVTTTGTSDQSGLGVYSACPTEIGAQCIAIDDAAFFGGGDPAIDAAFLENPGTYYIVFGSIGDCTPFSIQVDTVTCPIILPAASTCDKALNVGGCSTVTPEIIALNPGQGDPDFIVDGVNNGCFVAPEFNYSFFYFKAGANGKFGFTVESAVPEDSTDIDINVWGPIDSFDDICNFTSNNQPVRSTWTGGEVPTGLQDVHPGTGDIVTDDFDCGDPSTPSADGDNFVRRLDVIEGKYYVVLMDDFGGAIEDGGIAIDFTGTTEGVLVPEDGLPTAGSDTTICLGQSASLFATGGEAYFWQPTTGLSCSQCPNPIASPTESTQYQVQVATACNSVVLDVDVKIFDLNLGADVTVCSGATFELNENGPLNASYVWSGQSLSCNNCPTPTVGPLPPGTYTYVASLLTTFCLFKDTLVVTVLPAPQPQYLISDDQTICKGETIQLGGVAQPGTSYSWSSDPPGFGSIIANPSVSPTVNTTYYLTANNGSCPVPALDSVVVTVNEIPLVAVANDTAICIGQPVKLSSTIPQQGATYAWMANIGSMGQPDAVNPVESPNATTTYSLTASLGGCTIVRTIDVTVVPLVLQLNVPDTINICQGKSINIQASVSPSGNPISWSPPAGLTIAPNNLSAIAKPVETITYSIKSSLGGCNREVLVYVTVDSIPKDLDIMPSDTTVCQGQQVLLVSPIYEPGEYQYMEFEWTPAIGQLTPDSLYNMVISANETTIYRRITKNRGCVDTAFAVVNVIIPPEMMIVPKDTSICPNNPVQLTLFYPAGVTDIEWTPAAGLSCTDCDNPLATVNSNTVFTAQGTFMDCPVSASASISIKPPPSIVFPTDLVLCKGESVTLNSNVEPFTTYTWTSTDPAFSGSNLASPTVTPLLPSVTYSVTATNGCPYTGSVTISVLDATLNVSKDTSVCRNEPVLFTASGSLPGTYSWSSGQNTQAFTENIAATNNYIVTYTYGDGCTKTDNVLVTVNGESVPLDLPSPTQICPGDGITLNNESVPIGATYVWTAAPPDPTLGTSAGNPTVSPAGTTTYTVVATLGICVSTRTVTIGVAQGTLNPTQDTVICSGDMITLNANASPGTLLWSTGATSPSILVSPTNTTTYNVTLTYGNNCVLTESVKVTVIPSFELNIVSDPSNDTLNLGQTLELAASITPGGNIQQYTFEWLQNGTENIGTQQLITTTISTDDNTIRYVLVATSPGGCVREASALFTVIQPVVDVPNAFTPGNDTLNNTFKLIFIEGSGIIENMQIYNRWGQKIFTSTEAIKEWDGNAGGKPAPMDTYIYKISWRRLDGELQAPITGEVTLIR